MFFIVSSCLKRHFTIPHDRDTDKTTRNCRNPKKYSTVVENATKMVLFMCHEETALFHTERYRTSSYLIPFYLSGITIKPVTSIYYVSRKKRQSILSMRFHFLQVLSLKVSHLLSILPVFNGTHTFNIHSKLNRIDFLRDALELG